MDISQYIKKCYDNLPQIKDYKYPWLITTNLRELIVIILADLNISEFHINNNIAIHRSATIEKNVTVKPYTIIEKGSIVKSGAYLRDGVYIGNNVVIGPGCEIKQSIIFDQSRIAHFNYVGNSLIGEDVNLEAGAILANHFNEYENKSINVYINNNIMDTEVMKYGSLVGDHSRIGANAVLNPGTILNCRSIVGRLVHLDQIKEQSGLKNLPQ